jgi:hypothetical protein
LLALRNVLHGGVVDAVGLRNGHLLWTTWWVSDVALSGILLQRGALERSGPSDHHRSMCGRRKLQRSVVQAGAAQVEVEPWVLPAGVGAEVGGKPTAAADAGVDDVVAGKVGRWSRGGTPSGTSEEHFQMEPPQPSSSWFPCERGLHHPQ